MQATTTTTPTTTTTTTGTTTTGSTTPGADPSNADTIGEIVTGPLGSPPGSPFNVLNDAASEMAGSAFGRLAEVGLVAGEPAEVVIGDLTLTIHMLAAFVAFATIGTTLLFLILSPRRKIGNRLYHLGASTTKFLLVSSAGVTIGVALVELSGKLTSEAVELTLPDEINTDGANIYDAALAVVAVPMVEVAFSFQTFFVGILIAFWPLAAAVSILRSFKHALPIFTTLLVANVVWPPLAALAIGKAFAALPSVGAASWWCIAAVLTAPLANFVALAARSTT